MTSLNETFDLREKQAFAFRNRVPVSIIVLLYLAATLVCGQVSFFYARKTNQHLGAILALILMISMTLFVILDLDRPRRGLIRVEPESLLRLQAELNAQT